MTMKVKFAKVISMILAMIVITELIAPSDLFLSGTAFAATEAQEDRLNEGKKNISDDVDFWNDINIDYAFAHQVRMATNYANRQFSVGNGIGTGSYDGNLNASNIGPFYGYSVGEIENDEVNSPENIRSSNSDSLASVMYSKETLASAPAKFAQSGGLYTPSYKYYSYGLLLSMTGLDDVGSGAVSATRNIYGWLAQASYFAASSVNMIFETCFDFLWATNPFMFFKDISTTDSGSAELSSIYDNASSTIGGNTDGSVGALSEYFGKIFNMFLNFAWTVSIPLSLLFIIITFFLTRRGRYSIGSNLKKFVVKVLFIAMGIPILGSAYTQVLDGMRETQSNSNNFLSQAVSYTFVDFRRWVETSRLTPPSGDNVALGIIVEQRDSEQNGDANALVSGKTIRNLRRICSAINQQSGLFSFSSATDGLTVSKTGILLKDYIYDTSSDAFLSTSGTTVTEDYSNRQSVNDILKDYKDGIKYSATMFESGAVAWMQKQDSSSSVITYGDMIALSADKYSFSQNAERQIHGLQGKVEVGDIKYDPKNPGEAGTYSAVAQNRFASADFAGVGYNIWNNGALTTVSKGMGGGSGDHGEPMVGYEFASPADLSPGVNLGYNCKKPMGLSTMSMYTYLTSEFTQAGIITYGNSPTVYTHNFHYAVNLIGCNPIMQFAFLINMLAILLGYFFLAAAYVFRTVFDILFKGFQIMGHALLAAVGFYKSIGTCICMVVNMIAQLFITVVFFSLMSDFMFMTTSIFDNFFFNILDKIADISGSYNSNCYTASVSYSSEIVVMLSSFLSSFVIAFFVSFAIKWRSLIMATINNMVENIVGTLLGVNLSGASDGVVGGMAKAALNDAVNVAGVTAAVGGGTALASGVQDMINDFTSGDDNDETASGVDGAVNPTTGSGFNGGKGAAEDDKEAKAEGMDALENGLGEKQGEQSADEDKTNEGETGNEQNKSGGEFDEMLNTVRSALNAVGALPREDASTGDETEGKTEENHRSGSGEGRARGSSESGSHSDNTAVNSDVSDENSVSDDNSNANADSAANGADEKLNNSEALAEMANADAVGTAEAASEGAVQTEETATDENGTEWKQTDTGTGATSGISFDATRGLVMTSVGEDGTVSDVAVGWNGLSLGSTDENGNRTVSTVNTSGMQTAYTGVDGTTETTTTSFDGANSSVSVSRTDADGNSETITSGLSGQTAERIEKSEDGSVKTTTVNADGTKSVAVDNAETGYHSVTDIAADGSSTQTETIGNVETVTNSNADGVVTSKSTTSTDANGQKSVSSYALNSDGSVTRSTQVGSAKTTTVEKSDGSMSQIQSSVLSNGTIAETTTDYAADGTQVGDVTTTVKSADGSAVISQSTASSGSDSLGSYTMTSVDTPTGTVERKDYGSGHVVTTETSSNGDTAVTEADGNGGYVITETDASTGNVKKTTINQSTAHSVTSDASGNVVEEVDLQRSSDGTISYNNLAGGTISTSSEGEGDNLATVVTMSYSSGGSDIVSTNVHTGDTTRVSTDGIGGTNTATINTETGSVEINEIRADGTAVHSVNDGNGGFTETITYSNGGVHNTVRTGSTEKVTYSDGSGNVSVVVTDGGDVTYRSGNSSDGSSYVQEIDSSGNWNTTQTMTSGDRISTVKQSGGGYTRTVTYANGATRTETLENGELNVSTKSVSGIETNTVRTDTTTSSTVRLDGMTLTEKSDIKTGSVMRSVTIADQLYEIFTESDGSTKTSFQMPNDVRGSYKANTDGSQVHIITQPDNSSRVETISVNGGSSVVYLDAYGNTITESTEITRLNDAYATSVDAFNSSMASAYESLNAADIGSITSLDSFEIPAPKMNMTMSGIMSDVLPGTADEEFNKTLFYSMTSGGTYGRPDTWSGGSTSG